MMQFISKMLGIKLTSPWIEPQSAKTLLSGTTGVILGAIDTQLLTDTSMKSVAVLGPCRSGKSTSIVVPTLLNWTESAIVIDIGGELHSITGATRRTLFRNEVRQLAFGDSTSQETYNFLDAIPRGSSDELAKIQALAADLLGEGQSIDGVWCKHLAQSLLTLFIIAKRSNLTASLLDVQQAVLDDAVFTTTIATYLESSPSNELDRAAKVSATTYTELESSARSAVRAVVLSSLNIFASPEVARNTTRSSFDLSELRDSESAMTLFLTVKPHDLARIQPLIRAFIAQAVLRNNTQKHRQDTTHHLLLVLEDFTSLGRLPFLENSQELSLQGIKLLLTLQSLNQVNSVYGEGSRLWQQSGIRLVLGINNFETALSIAKEIICIANQGGHADAIQRQPLITPVDLMRLGDRETVILGATPKPIRASKSPYYERTNLSVSAN